MEGSYEQLYNSTATVPIILLTRKGGLQYRLSPSASSVSTPNVPRRRSPVKSEVDALGVITISRGCFERCCSNKKTLPYHSSLSFVALQNRRPTVLRAPA